MEREEESGEEGKRDSGSVTLGNYAGGFAVAHNGAVYLHECGPAV